MSHLRLWCDVSEWSTGADRGWLAAEGIAQASAGTGGRTDSLNTTIDVARKDTDVASSTSSDGDEVACDKDCAANGAGSWTSIAAEAAGNGCRARLGHDGSAECSIGLLEWSWWRISRRMTREGSRIRSNSYFQWCWTYLAQQELAVV